jgi:hypothetical protein
LQLIGTTQIKVLADDFREEEAAWGGTDKGSRSGQSLNNRRKADRIGVRRKAWPKCGSG